MRISELNFRNLRLFGDAEQCVKFAADKNVSILLGDNGAGKTSLLHGMTVLLSQYFEPFPSVPSKSFADDDVHMVSTKRRADYLHVGLQLQARTCARRQRTEHRDHTARHRYNPRCR